MTTVYAGKAIGLAFGGALIGSIIGGGLNSWLRVDIVPIGVSLTHRSTLYRLGIILCAMRSRNQNQNHLHEIIL